MKKARGKEGEGRPASPPIHITVGLELSQTQYSLSVELISHVEPTTRGREGDRGTRQDSSAAAERKREGQKATLSNRVARSVGRSFSGFLTKDVYVPAS